MTSGKRQRAAAAAALAHPRTQNGARHSMPVGDARAGGDGYLLNGNARHRVGDGRFSRHSPDGDTCSLASIGAKQREHDARKFDYRPWLRKPIIPLNSQ